MIDFKRYDPSKDNLNGMKFWLVPIARLLASECKRHDVNIKYINSEDFKGPALIITNHNAFFDFKVWYTVLKYRRDMVYTCAITAFRNVKFLLHKASTIGKRKYTDDLYFVKEMKKAIANNNSVLLSPEARYSMVGKLSVLPSSLGKFVKFLKVPLYTLVCHGNHIVQPFWNQTVRNVKGTSAILKYIASAEEIEKMSVEEINELLGKELQYDDFKYQRENKIKCSQLNRAEGLHQVLYQCPECGKEFHMGTFGSTLFCKSCKAKWEMDEYGVLHGLNHKEKFQFVPDWYDWEKKNVTKEVEEGRYTTGKLKCRVESFPNKKLIKLGKGTFIHNGEGFKCVVTDKLGYKHSIIQAPHQTYTVDIELNWLKTGESPVLLNTVNDTWFVYPENTKKYSATKIVLATEALYYLDKKKKGEKIIEGWA